MDTLHEDRRIFMVISNRIFLRIRNISKIYFRGNQTIHVMFNNFFQQVFMRRCAKRWQNQTVHRGYNNEAQKRNDLHAE